MSLRKSPELTPALLAALRRNAQKSTGPKTARGKALSSLNALKHGRYAQNLPQKIRAAGVRVEPDSFARLRRAISVVFGDGRIGRILYKSISNGKARAIWNASQLRRSRSVRQIPAPPSLPRGAAQANQATTSSGEESASPGRFSLPARERFSDSG